MARVKYHASGRFDIDTEVEVPDNTSIFNTMMAIYKDLEDRYGLEITIVDGLEIAVKKGELGND